MKPRSCLIVINSLEIGGPQKSLIGLLQRIDPKRFNIGLLVLQGVSGPLLPSVPDHVTILPSDPLYRAATVPKKEALRSLKMLAIQVGAVGSMKLLLQILRSICVREPRTRLRQRVWRSVSRDLPPIPGRYDMALGILGQATYAALDLSDSRDVYHWVRSDSRVLDRDERIEAAYFSGLSGSVAVSTACAQIFEGMYPSMRGLVKVYKNDIPTRDPTVPSVETGQRADADFQILTIGRLDTLKGIDIAVDACAVLVSQGFDLRWVVLGEGPEHEALVEQIAGRGLQTRFLLAGNVLDTDSFMRSADVYVHPSRTEGRSNAVEEARAAGLPIVACAYPTVGDQVDHGVTGLVSATDALALASVLGRLLPDGEARQTLGQAAKRAYHAEQDDPNTMLNDLCRDRT